MMTSGVREWLPPGALESESVHAAAAALVDGWSRRWFAGVELKLTRIDPARERAGLRHAADPAATEAAQVQRSIWDSDDGHLQASLHADGDDLISRHALRRSSDDEVTEDDRPLLDSFIERLVNDLLTTFSSELGLKAIPFDRSGRGAKFASLTLGDGKRSILSLSLTARATRALIAKALSGTPTSAFPALVPIDVALDQTALHIELRLGSMRLNASELQDLTVGDVIVLDRAINGGFDLAIADSSTVFGRADFTNDGGTPQIRFRGYI